MSKGRSSTQQVTSYNIPPELMQTQQEVFQRARDFSPQVFTGDRFAQVNPFEAQQLQTLADFGADRTSINQAQNVIGGLLGSGVGSPDLLRQELNRDLGSNYLNRVIDDRLADTVNDITSRFALSGRLGSDAMGDALGRGIGSAVAPILAENERAEAQRRQGLAQAIIDAERGQVGTELNIASALPQLQNLELQRLSALGTAGDIQRTMDERSILADRERIAEENAAELARLNALLAAGGQGNLGIGSTTTQFGSAPPIGDSILGAGLLARALLPV